MPGSSQRAYLHAVIARCVLHAVVESRLRAVVRDNDLCAQLLGRLDELLLAGGRRHVIDLQVWVLGVAGKQILDECRLSCRWAGRQAALSCCGWTHLADRLADLGRPSGVVICPDWQTV